LFEVEEDEPPEKPPKALLVPVLCTVFDPPNGLDAELVEVLDCVFDPPNGFELLEEAEEVEAPPKGLFADVEFCAG